MTSLRILPLLALACVLAGACGGCGDDDNATKDLPDGAAATVRGHVITDAAVDRAVVGQLAIRHSAESMPAYLPADIAGCVASLRGKGDSDDDALRERCEEERDRHEDAALGLLIRGQWYRLDAERRGTPVPTDRKGAAEAAEHAGVDTRYLRGVAEVYMSELAVATRAGSANEGAPQAAVARYGARLQEAYGDDTVCADGYDAPECG